MRWKMIEKVNPSHPDKLADRIAGAIVDLAYQKNENPKVAVEVLIGHGSCNVIVESSEDLKFDEIKPIVSRIAGEDFLLHYYWASQDVHLAENQANEIRCGDNGIFKGSPLTAEQIRISHIASHIYDAFPYDGKYILDDENKVLIICQSNASFKELTDYIVSEIVRDENKVTINPLGEWTGGPYVDSGATNRKLGSDMFDSITGGGLHGKDLSKADVSVNIYAFLKAQKEQKEIKLYCAIGDSTIDGRPYSEIVEIARKFIQEIGGFEKFAEWGYPTGPPQIDLG